MAKIHEEVITVKLSKLVKNSTTDSDSVITAEIIGTLEEIVQELVGEQIIVEIC